MLRVLIGLLFIANLGFWGWTQGWLDGVVGVRAIGDREPERLSKQVRPEAIRVLTPEAVQAAASEAESHLTCLESGVIAPEQIAAAQRALAATVPGIAFTSVKLDKPGTWLVYMGRYAAPDALQRKRDELTRTRLPFSEVTTPVELAPGFSLGAFDSREGADAALDRFARSGVRTARVVEAAKPGVSWKLRVPRADPDAAAKLFATRSESLGSGFGGCPAADTASAASAASTTSPASAAASVSAPSAR